MLNQTVPKGMLQQALKRGFGEIGAIIAAWGTETNLTLEQEINLIYRIDEVYSKLCQDFDIPHDKTNVSEAELVNILKMAGCK